MKGIHLLEGCKDVDVAGNTILNCDTAIFAKNVERPRVAGNVIAHGDPVALVKALLDLGVTETEVAELGQAVDADVENGGGSYPRVRAWIESVAKKAAVGALTVSGGAASAVIAELLLKHFGIKP